MSHLHAHSPSENEEEAQSSPSTNVTTPDQQPSPHDANSDIWASDNDTDHNQHGSATVPSSINAINRNRGELLSDLPTIKRQHMTDGYREGLSVGKAQVMQSGFDAGYPIGVQIAMRAGKVVGVLEGCLASKSIEAMERKAELEKMLEAAKRELACTALLDGVRDDVIANAEGVMDCVREVLERWEVRVFGRVDGINERKVDAV